MSGSGIRYLLLIHALLWIAVLPFASPLTASAAGSSDLALQQRIDQAEEGVVLEIPEGEYEGPIQITKRLHLAASPEAQVVLRNQSDQPAVTIAADDAKLTGIQIIDIAAKVAPTIMVTGNRAVLEDLHIITGTDGIRLAEAQQGRILNNIVEWGAGETVPFSRRGNGIDLYQSPSVIISGNTVRGMFDAIYVEFSDDALVEDNLVESSRYGIHTMYSKRPVLRGNRGSMNVTGAMVMEAAGAEVRANTFTKQHENVNAQGILLYDVHESIIAENRIEGNRVGFYVESSTGNRIESNAVIDNFIGIQLLEASGNTITENIFAGNVTDALAKDSAQNDLSGNFWDSFSGIDADGDGRSDIPYKINPFFQGLIERRPVFQLFFQAPGITFLETLYAADQAGWAADEAPLMAPPDRWQPSDDEPAGFIVGAGSLMMIILSLAIIGVNRRRIT